MIHNRKDGRGGGYSWGLSADALEQARIMSNSLDTIREKIPFIDDSGSLCSRYSTSDCLLNGWKPAILVEELSGYGQKFDGYVVTVRLQGTSFKPEYQCQSLQDVSDYVDRILSEVESIEE